MASKQKALASALKVMLKAVNDGATPTPKQYFNQVWIGMPDKIPQAHKNVCVIEPAANPHFYYTTCPAQTQQDIDFYVHCLSKGNVEDANLTVLEVTEAVLNTLILNPKISNTCIGSTIEEVNYGDLAQDGRNLITGSKILLRCKL